MENSTRTRKKWAPQKQETQNSVENRTSVFHEIQPDRVYERTAIKRCAPSHLPGSSLLLEPDSDDQRSVRPPRLHRPIFGFSVCWDRSSRTKLSHDVLTIYKELQSSDQARDRDRDQD